MESILGYAVAAIVAVGFGWFLYRKFTAPKNTNKGSGGGSKGGGGKQEY